MALTAPLSALTLLLLLLTAGPAAAQSRCADHEATCADGSCISAELRCDGYADCPDGSDESSCGRIRCEPNEFLCANQRCAMKNWLCDGDNDCGDNSDEQNCQARDPGSSCRGTEFQCRDGRQCIPRTFQCDDRSDCQDDSDEIGCAAPTIVEQPPAVQVVRQGSVFVIRCRAVGNPTPQISWRRNWGHVPNKCQQVSEGGRGVLTCPDAAEADQGAYSCEAINTIGVVFAIPDTNVVVTNGGLCQPPQFNSAALTNDDCLKCFCFGVSTNCYSSALFVSELPVLDARAMSQVMLNPASNGYSPALPAAEQPYQGSAGEILVESPPGVDGQMYFQLPDSHGGDQLNSYGGYIRFTAAAPAPADVAVIVIRGNGITLYHATDAPPETGLYEVQLTPSQFTKAVEGGRDVAASREDIMMVLQNIDMFLVSAPPGPDGRAAISGFRMDSAGVVTSPAGPASLVESCRCPDGYTGLSCQECAAGYQRVRAGPFLGRCEPEPQECSAGEYGDPARGIACRPCPCPGTPHQYASTCFLDSDDQVTCNCPPEYDGRRCERCAVGYRGSPLQGEACVRARECDPAGSLSERPDPRTGQCQCKEFVTGRTCDQCKPRAFYLHVLNPHGCVPCFCMGVTDQCATCGWYRSQVSSAGAAAASLTDDTAEAELPGAASDGRSLVVSDPSQFGGQPAYWSLSSQFLGNKVTSYGGYLRFTMSFSGQQPGDYQLYPDVEILGNDVRLLHSFDSAHAGDAEVTVPLIETAWRRSDGGYVNREHLMMALADLDYVIIKAADSPHAPRAALSSVSLDIAVEQPTGQSQAFAVERCSCPAGYTGLSCEDCAPGFTRSLSGLYLRSCVPCECGGRSGHCDPETGDCLDCRDNTAGPNCNECAAGYSGDPSRNIPCQPSGGSGSGISSGSGGGGSGGGYSGGSGGSGGGYSGGSGGSGGDGGGGSSGSGGYGGGGSGGSGGHGGGGSGGSGGHGGGESGGSGGGASGGSGDGSSGGSGDGISGGSGSGGSGGGVGGGGSGGFSGGSGSGISSGSGPSGGGRPGYERPRALISPRYLQLNVGEPARLECTASGNPPPRLEWTGGREDVIEPDVYLAGGMLSIAAVRKAHESQYFCTASNAVGTDRVRTVIYVRGEDRPAAPPSPGGHGSSPGAQQPDRSEPQRQRPGDGSSGAGDSGEDGSSSGGASPGSSGGAGHPASAQQSERPQRRPEARDDRRSYSPLQVRPQRASVFPGESVELQCLSADPSFSEHAWSRSDGAALPGSASAVGNTLVIAAAADGDGGVYICTARDSQGRTAQSSAYVTVTAPEPPRVQVYPSDRQQISAGGSALFQCRVASGRPEPSVTWRRSSGDGQLPASAQLLPGAVLRFLRVRGDESGQYECVASNAAGEVIRTASLNVVSAPVVTLDQPVQLRVREGDPVHMSCSASGMPTPIVVWEAPHRPGPDTSQSGVPGRAELDIASASSAHSGIYTCRAENEAGRGGARLRLIVDSPRAGGGRPPVAYPHGYEDRRARLRPGVEPYDASGADMHGAEVIQSGVNEERHRAGTEPHGAPDGGRARHDGAAQPAAAEAPKAAEEEAAAAGHGAPEIGGHIVPTEEEYVVPLNGRAELTCEVIDATVPVTISWFRSDGAPLPADHVIRQGTLYIGAVAADAAGQYTCVGMGASDVVLFQASARLTVIAPPAVFLAPERQVVRPGGQVSIDCATSGDQPMELTWNKEGARSLPGHVSVVDGKLVFGSIAVSDAGRYICTAENAAGRARGVAEVIVNEAPVESPPACALGEVPCGSGECLSSDAFCDGVLDCADGSDETYCSIPTGAEAPTSSGTAAAPEVAALTTDEAEHGAAEAPAELEADHAAVDDYAAEVDEYATEADEFATEAEEAKPEEALLEAAEAPPVELTEQTGAADYATEEEPPVEEAPATEEAPEQEEASPAVEDPVYPDVDAALPELDAAPFYGEDATEPDYDPLKLDEPIDYEPENYDLEELPEDYEYDADYYGDYNK